MQCANGLAVVAQLGVVIVLEDHAAGLAGPVAQREPAFRGEHRAGRELVRRSDQHGVGRGVTELVDADAELV